MTKTKSPPIDALTTLGPIAEYRECPQRLTCAVNLMDRRLMEYSVEMKAKGTLGERADFALSVVNELVSTTRQRASDCMDLHTTVACENTDLLWFLAEWVGVAKAQIQELQSTAAPTVGAIRPREP